MITSQDEFVYTVCLDNSVKLMPFEEYKAWLEHNLQPNSWLWQVNNGFCLVFKNQQDSVEFALAWL